PTTPLCSPYPRTPPTPKAPLFPYTTLFRSRRLRAPDRPHRARAKRGRRVHFDEWGRTARTSGNRAVHRTKNSTTQAREFSLHLHHFVRAGLRGRRQAGHRRWTDASRLFLRPATAVIAPSPTVGAPPR